MFKICPFYQNIFRAIIPEQFYILFFEQNFSRAKIAEKSHLILLIVYYNYNLEHVHLKKKWINETFPVLWHKKVRLNKNEVALLRHFCPKNYLGLVKFQNKIEWDILKKLFFFLVYSFSFIEAFLIYQVFINKFYLLYDTCAAEPPGETSFNYRTIIMNRKGKILIPSWNAN